MGEDTQGSGTIQEKSSLSPFLLLCWDARNRLVSISGGSTATFHYDALGRRVSKVIGSTASQVLYDGNDIAAEIGGSAVGTSYLRSLNIDEPFVRKGVTGNEFYHADALGSSLALSNPQGASATMYTYEPFGKTTVTGTSANAFQFTGRENDGTGLYYYRARYYQPRLQRFISDDPLGLNGGINFYEYALNDPTNYIDPPGQAGSPTRGGRGTSGADSGFDRSHLGDIGDALRQQVDPDLGAGLSMSKLQTLVDVENMRRQKGLSGQSVSVIISNGQVVNVLPQGVGVICMSCSSISMPPSPNKPIDPRPVPSIRLPRQPSMPGSTGSVSSGQTTSQILGKRK